MLKVLAIVDKEMTAIDRLAVGLSKYHNNIDYRVMAVHPKRPSSEQLELFEKEAMNADLIDWQYFKTANMLRSRYEWLKSKKQILTHYNPYSIEDGSWDDYDLVIGDNEYVYNRLCEITTAPVVYVGLTVDTDFWTFNHEWEPNHNVLMVANRIESKKGILPVAKACATLGLTLHLVGSISNMEYFQEVSSISNTVFHQGISDDELKKLYYNSTVLVCNSVDGFESGTLPILESMLCGTPVLTRKIGHVPELYNGSNLVTHDGDSDDVDAISDLLYKMISDKKKLSEIRESAWNTAKVRSNERRAYEYQRIYRQILYPNSLPVTVVMPVYDKPDIVRKCLDAIARQTYDNIELIVCDDSVNSMHKEAVTDFSNYVSFPVRYINTAKIVIDNQHPDGYKDYGLARSRNIGTIEATGDIIVYIDQRQVPDDNAVEEFVKYAKPRYWVFGNKGSGKKEFIENFSCAYRRDVIMSGMFNERCDKYGSMSEELRKRIRYQGIKTEYIASAKATPTGKSSNRHRKRSEIILSKNMCWKMFSEEFMNV